MRTYGPVELVRRPCLPPKTVSSTGCSVRHAGTTEALHLRCLAAGDAGRLSPPTPRPVNMCNLRRLAWRLSKQSTLPGCFQGPNMSIVILLLRYSPLPMNSSASPAPAPLRWHMASISICAHSLARHMPQKTPNYLPYSNLILEPSRL